MNEKPIIFIGDSLTYGYGIKKSENWVYMLKSKLNIPLLNKGINGNTTVDILFRFDKDVLKLNPSLIFIMAGTNDLLSNRSIESIIMNLEIMIKDALSIDSKVIIGIPPTICPEDAYRLFSPCNTYNYCKKSLPLLREKLIYICNKYNISYIDFYTITDKNINNNIFIDGIHLNAFGQNLLYSEILNYFL